MTLLNGVCILDTLAKVVDGTALEERCFAGGRD